MLSRIECLLLGAVLGFASSAAFAFQESKGGASPEPQDAAQQQPLDLTGTGTSVDTSNTGTEVRIPGLGKLGVLPKFDFGLELLYGVNDAKQGATDQLRMQQNEDTTIRGSLKHRF